MIYNISSITYNSLLLKMNIYNKFICKKNHFVDNIALLPYTMES